MKIITVSKSDIVGGGAFRAAYRIHRALLAEGVDSSMWVNVAGSGDWTVHGPTSRLGKVMARIRPLLGSASMKLLKTTNTMGHSPALLPSTLPKRLNSSDADLVHMHWVNGEMLSIKDVSRIAKPLVWTLHDMWGFCGAEHYTDDARWQEGYTSQNRPSYESGFDLNRWVWSRKRKYWKSEIHIVAVSHWLADCVRKSKLMSDWPVSVIPNVIDTESWQPIDKGLARQLMRLPTDGPLLAFGAVGGGRDPRKGFDLLVAALGHLQGELAGLQLLVFGQLAPRDPLELGFPIHYAGYLHDHLSLRTLYSAADAMVVPSRQESFGQTASEAHACGTPVVAFDTGGLPDIVKHQSTGYLAKVFDPVDLAAGIKWVLQHPNYNALSQAARKKAQCEFDSHVVAKRHVALYQQILKKA